MNAREWEEREARDDLYERRLANDARFHEPSDSVIDAELERRAELRDITVAEMIQLNQKEIDMLNPVHVIAVIDEDGNEALYVGGELHKTEGDTVYMCDVSEAVGDEVIQFSQVYIEGFGGEWPEKFDSLLQCVSKD